MIAMLSAVATSAFAAISVVALVILGALALGLIYIHILKDDTLQLGRRLVQKAYREKRLEEARKGEREVVDNG